MDYHECRSNHTTSTTGGALVTVCRGRLVIMVGWLGLLFLLPPHSALADACGPCEVNPITGCNNYCAVTPPGEEPPGPIVTPPPPPDEPGPEPGEPGEPSPEPGDPVPPGAPLPTPTPPKGLGPGTGNQGHWAVDCVLDARFCTAEPAVVVRWCVDSGPQAGSCYLISTRCQLPGECTVITPEPTTEPGPEWPCQREPYLADGRLIQPCPKWPGWEIEVEVLIPPAEVLRNPWPRSLVAYPTKLWFQGAPDVEAWSNEKAVPCAVDYGATYTDPADFPVCSHVGGQVSAGTQVNYQVGAAWRHWDPSQGSIFGFAPTAEVSWSIPDREWNGGTKQYFGYYAEHSFETTSWGLTENGPAWNPACQQEVCACDARVQGWDMPAYQATITNWWYPQYNLRRDEFYCSSYGWSDCFCRGTEPLGQPHSSCSNRPASCPATSWYGKIQHCSAWRWRQVADGWQTYELAKLGYTPIIPWYLVRQAGADPQGQQCGSYGPAGGTIAIPVIEVQPVGVP